MTPEEIDKLEAGPELDAIMCHELMGFEGCVAISGDHGDMFFPTYSTDIKAAWAVVEKLRKLNYNLSLFYSDEGFYCHFGQTELAGQAGTAPLAICRAALKAVASVDTHSYLPG